MAVFRQIQQVAESCNGSVWVIRVVYPHSADNSFKIGHIETGNIHKVLSEKFVVLCDF
jgi:hypothetical protein